jgi:hypothetical protein
VKIQLAVSLAHAKAVSVETERPAQMLTSALKIQVDAMMMPSAPTPTGLARVSASLDSKEMV